MKAFLSYLAKRFDVIVLLVFLVSLYAVFQIRFGWFWPISKTDNADTINSILEGLSYSYIAAYIFYLLTVKTPSFRRKEKLKPILQKRVGTIGRLMRDVLLEFTRGTAYQANVHDTEHTADILKSKNWDLIVPLIQQYRGVSITYFGYTNAMCSQVKECISDIIICYREDLSEDQIVALEQFRDISFFNLVSSLHSFPSITVNGNADSLASEFVKMQKAYLQLEKEF